MLGFESPLGGVSNLAGAWKTTFLILLGCFWEYRHYGCARDCKSFPRLGQLGSIPNTPTKDINAIKFTLYQAVCVGSTPACRPYDDNSLTVGQPPKKDFVIFVMSLFF